VYLIQDIVVPFRIISTGISATVYTRFQTSKRLLKLLGERTFSKSASLPTQFA